MQLDQGWSSRLWITRSLVQIPHATFFSVWWIIRMNSYFICPMKNFRRRIIIFTVMSCRRNSYDIAMNFNRIISSVYRFNSPTLILLHCSKQFQIPSKLVQKYWDWCSQKLELYTAVGQLHHHDDDFQTLQEITSTQITGEASTCSAILLPYSK